MKKQILNIGKALTKVEQRNVFGGLEVPGCGTRGEMDNGCGCNYDSDCTSDNCVKEYHAGVGLCKAA